MRARGLDRASARVQDYFSEATVSCCGQYKNKRKQWSPAATSSRLSSMPCVFGRLASRVPKSVHAVMTRSNLIETAVASGVVAAVAAMKEQVFSPGTSAPQPDGLALDGVPFAGNMSMLTAGERWQVTECVLILGFWVPSPLRQAAFEELGRMTSVLSLLNTMEVLSMRTVQADPEQRAVQATLGYEAVLIATPHVEATAAFCEEHGTTISDATQGFACSAEFMENFVKMGEAIRNQPHNINVALRERENA